MAPLPNSRVIPKTWEAHHYAAAAGQMTAECTITRAASAGLVPAFNESTSRSTAPTPVTVYTGPCRIQHPTIQDMPAGGPERETMVSEYTVTIPVTTDLVQVRDLVTVVACDGDPDLVGLTLSVTGVPRGSLRFVQPLTCKLSPPPTTR